MSQPPRAVTGLSAIAADYDLFLLDQFGVLHDGSAPYPSALRALAGLRQAGKHVLVLTNSGKRAAVNLARLHGMGFAPASFDGLVSSGEVAWRMLSAGELGAPFIAGACAYIVGKRGDDYGFTGLGLEFVSDPGSADCLLILGSDAPKRSLDDEIQALAAAAARGIPALCANPDITMLTATGPQPAPGAIAAAYAALGGPVTYIGKPHAAIYRQCLRLAGALSSARVLAVGDSLAHDIFGAQHFGLGTALVRTGVSIGLSDLELATEMTGHHVSPDFLLPALDW